MLRTATFQSRSHFRRLMLFPGRHYVTSSSSSALSSLEAGRTVSGIKSQFILLRSDENKRFVVHISVLLFTALKCVDIAAHRAILCAVFIWMITRGLYMAAIGVIAWNREVTEYNEYCALLALTLQQSLKQVIRIHSLILRERPINPISRMLCLVNVTCAGCMCCAWFILDFCRSFKR